MLVAALRKLKFKFRGSEANPSSSTQHTFFFSVLRSEFVKESQQVGGIESGGNIRAVEVCGLGLIVGSVFACNSSNNTNNNSNSSSCSAGATISLMLFFTVTLWTFTRMHPAVVSAHQWRVRTLQRLVDDGTNDTDAIDVQAVVAASMVNQLSLIYSFIA